jgi:hypothetical protein
MVFTLLVETPFMILEKEFLMGGSRRSNHKVKNDDVSNPRSNKSSPESLVKKSDGVDFTTAINADPTRESLIDENLSDARDGIESPYYDSEKYK